MFFPIDSQVFTFHWSKTELIIEEVYSLDHTMEQLVRTLGRWNQTNHHHHHHFICKINKLHKEYTRYYVK